MLPLLVTLGLLVTTACDVVEPPYRQNSGGGGNNSITDSLVQDYNFDTLPDTRRVLLEEFTGIKCGFCPPAGKEALRLRAQYEDQVVFLQYHATGLAEPDDDGLYTADYTTQWGDELVTDFDLPGTPIGLINRMGLDVNGRLDSTLGYTFWDFLLQDQVLALPNEAKLGVSAQMTEDTRTLTVDVFFEALTDLPPDQFLVVVITEDSLVSPQKWYNNDPEDLENYVHRFVVRRNLTGNYGVPLSDGPIPEGTRLGQRLSTTIPQEWNADHLYVAAFISDNPSKDIRQAAETPVQRVN